MALKTEFNESVWLQGTTKERLAYTAYCGEKTIKAAAEKLATPKSTIGDALRRLEKKALELEAVKPVLVFGDLHAPYHHPRALEFLAKVHKERGCAKRVLSLGDLCDFHAMSRHMSEPDAMSPEEEYARALDLTKSLAELFPHGDLVLGNHDAIPARGLRGIGMSPMLLKKDNELFGLPSTWGIHSHYYVLKPESWNVLAEHGINSTGKLGALNMAIAKRTSFVQGHAHARAGVMYSANYNSTIFGGNAGCLCDESSLAMRYGRFAKDKGVLGCLVVYSGSHAEFIEMGSFLARH